MATCPVRVAVVRPQVTGMPTLFGGEPIVSALPAYGLNIREAVALEALQNTPF
ncbi:hypothetical protein [uncultured Hymenobacter sp.]|uniref:hypothetical protein n=1 Tax=uncultured Hymenobacter sp. TaxID=170016 RepID=UPI0035CC9C79